MIYNQRVFAKKLIYPLFLFRLFNNGTIKDPDHKAKYGKIYIIYKDEESVAFESITLCRKWFFGVGLVLLYEYEIF